MNVVKFSSSVRNENISVRLPLRAVVGSRTFAVPEWSTSGFRVAGFEAGMITGNSAPVRLILPFDAFDLAVSTTAKILQLDAAGKTADMAFVGLTKRQSELLQYVSDAYLSEELVSVDDLIEVVARTPAAIVMPSAPEPATLPKRARRAFGRVLTISALGIAALAMTAYLISSAYQRAFIVPAVSGLITVQSTKIVSPAAGIVKVAAGKSSFKVGDKVADVTTLTGEKITIASPCNCTVLGDLQNEPIPVAPGDAILDLGHDDARPSISAFVHYSDLQPLYRGASVKLFFADGTESRDAEIGALPPLSPEDTPTSALIEIKIKTGAELKRELVGQPVFVLFDTGPF